MNKNRREPPRPEDSKLGPDHYIAAWNGPIGVTLSWLAFVIAFLWLSFILTYSWMVRPERETIAMLAGTFLSLFGLYSFVLVSIGMFRNSIEVELRPTEVQGRSLYGRRKEVSFKDIRSITALRYGAKGVAIRTFSDPKL
ncbi:MAG: hypothetical protein KDK33_10230, partial [Leptospiraceae bacterium]|nr:hypothetical protein [Leptospiraceae bacterium]